MGYLEVLQIWCRKWRFWQTALVGYILPRAVGRFPPKFGSGERGWRRPLSRSLDRYPILKSQRLQKKFVPPGKSTQTALPNLEKGKISHIKKPEASKEVRPSWKKHPKGRYHTRTVDPFCNKSHPKEEISNTCCRPSHAWNKHPKGRYHTRIVDPFCCKSHPKEEISNTCCRPYLDSLPILSVSMNG